MSEDNVKWLATALLIGEWTIRLVMLAVVPYRCSPSSATSWLAVIFFMPWFGVLLFAFLGRATLPRKRRKILDQVPVVMEKRINELRTHANIRHPEVPVELEQAVILAEGLGRMPILAGNRVELLADCEEVINRLIADIDAATHHVHMLFYIFETDETGNRVIAAMERAVKRGVVCRVLVDGLGSRRPLRKLRPKLKKAGIESEVILPISLIQFWKVRVDLRNHRKIAVIDGKIGYTGSQNIVHPTYKPGIHYEELMVRVVGPLVLQLQYVFIVDWSIEHNEVLSEDAMFPDPDPPGDVAAQSLPSGPEYETDEDDEPSEKHKRYRQAAEHNQRLIVALLHGARKRVVLTTPYFIPDEPLLQAMETAVLRGVDVRLVVSKKEDQFLVSHAQKSYYGQLLDMGVKIFLYHQNFLHAKHISFDDNISLIGSSNLDIRSFALNAEINVLFYDEKITAELRQHQERYFAGADQLNAMDWNKRPLASKITQRLARLMSPLL